MFHGVATSLLGVFKQRIDDKPSLPLSDSELVDLIDGPRAWQEPETVSLSYMNERLIGTQTAKETRTTGRAGKIGSQSAVGATSLTLRGVEVG
jgi:hypothetical protein